MTKRTGQRLNRAKKFLLASAGFAALAGPLVIGIGYAPAAETAEAPSAAPLDATAQAADAPVPPVQATNQQQVAIGRSTETAPTFEAASIKPNSSAVGGGGGRGGRGGGLQITPGRVVGRNVTSRQIILEAYGLKDYQLSGGPGWLDFDRFDLEAKAEGPANENQLRPMLQTLLGQRFKLVVHGGTKDMAVYAMTIGKNGPKFPELKEGVPPPPAPREDGIVFKERQTATLQDFGDRLSQSSAFGRPVLDKTGLLGVYVFDIVLHAGEDFMTMAQERFGLKFESQKAAMDILVIEHIERPDAN